MQSGLVNFQNDFSFVIDSLSAESCSGWYARKDEKDNSLVFLLNDREVARVSPDIPRPDVVAAKAGPLISGYKAGFHIQLRSGDKLEVRASDEELLASFAVPTVKGREPRTDKTLLAEIDSFVELDIDSPKLELFDRNILDQYERLTNETLAADGFQYGAELIRLISEIRADLHYVKTAYIESVRYKEPRFDDSIPKQDKKLKPSDVAIDMRSNVTGGNWYHAEPLGRWAGPENHSSIIIPAMEQGQYRIEIDISGEIKSGILDEMELSVNGSAIAFERASSDVPTFILGLFSVGDDYLFPFWVVNLEFRKLYAPSELGGTDKRKLAICVQAVRLVKVS